MEWLGGNFPQRRAFAFYYRVLYRRSVGQRAIAARARARALYQSNFLIGSTAGVKLN